MKKIVATILVLAANSAWACPGYLDQTYRQLHSRDSINLCEAYEGQPMLVVNTASQCGFRGQFGELEELYQTYRDRGLAVVGFASDDFNQEADTEKEAADVCRVNYGVSFTMIAPTPVTGDNANPLFSMIRSQGEGPEWNFYKYVLNPEGELTASFPSRVAPSDEELVDAVESVLKQ
ncbi:glutathione peroxidase [uncultured Halovibrio sp.]|uniref:glutathione peroxidase n=1 Tax=uncultured Halovibrio sp. TaxID=985049 RepID=UPI0025E82BA0|nr:glutathione peroxidase [uncultured Halovibrio sp.]